MNLKTLLSNIALGEDSSRQFKVNLQSSESLAAEMTAFANSEGGHIYIGVEELRRLFQITDQFYADELPTKVGIEKIDKLRFRDFIQRVYEIDYPESVQESQRLLQNMNLMTDD